MTTKLRTEIANNSISSPIRDAEARNLPYLQAVIKEGLRIFPPVVRLMSKEVPPEGDIIKADSYLEGRKLGSEHMVSFEIRGHGAKMLIHFGRRVG